MQTFDTSSLYAKHHKKKKEGHSWQSYFGCFYKKLSQWCSLPSRDKYGDQWFTASSVNEGTDGCMSEQDETALLHICTHTHKCTHAWPKADKAEKVAFEGLGQCTQYCIYNVDRQASLENIFSAHEHPSGRVLNGFAEKAYFLF